VILHRHREALLPGIERGALRDGPRDEDTPGLETNVVVESRRAVFLYDEEALGPLRLAAPWLRGLREVALSLVLAERARPLLRRGDLYPLRRVGLRLETPINGDASDRRTLGCAGTRTPGDPTARSGRAG
jgi:hypothetical protein